MKGGQRLIVGISGASGVIYGVRLLETLSAMPVETHLIVTKSGELTIAHEMDRRMSDIRALADYVYPVQGVAAAVSSGSFHTMGMIVAPCSMRTLGEIASGVTSNLLTRAADVVLKERRRLVLLVRETPFHAVHLHNMLTATEMGAIVAPPLPAFYPRPESIDDLLDHTIGRTLDLFGLDTGRVKRWGEKSGKPPKRATRKA